MAVSVPLYTRDTDMGGSFFIVVPAGCLEEASEEESEDRTSRFEVYNRFCFSLASGRPPVATAGTASKFWPQRTPGWVKRRFLGVLAIFGRP